MTNLNTNKIFIRCSAPTLCGIKPSNLFIAPCEGYSECLLESWKREFNNLGLSIEVFKSSKDAVMFFVYDFLWIRKILDDSFVQAYLMGKGYSNISDTKKTITELIDRLKHSDVFPHEVGIFLGYPVEDVIGFEKNQSKNCKFCGYWKSYSNPEEAKRCCMQYKICIQLCKKWFDEGMKVPQIIKKYKEATLGVA